LYGILVVKKCRVDAVFNCLAIRQQLGRQSDCVGQYAKPILLGMPSICGKCRMKNIVYNGLMRHAECE